MVRLRLVQRSLGGRPRASLAQHTAQHSLKGGGRLLVACYAVYAQHGPSTRQHSNRQEGSCMGFTTARSLALPPAKLTCRVAASPKSAEPSRPVALMLAAVVAAVQARDELYRSDRVYRMSISALHCGRGAWAVRRAGMQCNKGRAGLQAQHVSTARTSPRLRHVARPAARVA